MISSMSSPTAPSTSSSPWSYDVFLSFRGEDTRNTFTAHLYHSLISKGIHTYIDEDGLRRGDEISPALLQAIEGSRISLVVLSKDFASSTWCLDELLKILELKKSKQQIVLPVFYYIDPSDVRHQRGNFGETFAKHAEKLNLDMKLQVWKAALQEVSNLSGYHLRNGNESKFIEEIVQGVSRITNDHLCLDVAKHPVGLKPQLEDVNLLLSVGTDDRRMVGIFGVGGIGKTTLAKAIYNSIAFRFEASCFLANVSQTSNQAYGLVQLQETLLSKILGDCRSLKVDSVSMGINMIKCRLRFKRVLLILDDVDHLTQLESLTGAHDWFGKGSRIIITTRDQHLLTIHGVDSRYKMMGLNHYDASQLFCLHAFKREKPINGYGKFVAEIINYAGSLPLVLTVLGSDLYGRTESEWIQTLDQYKKIPHRDIQKILQTSYDRLSDGEKNIFLDIACFFIGDMFHDVIKILDSFGFCPNFWIPRLREKCLIFELDKKLQMHDMLRDMGREVVRQESPRNPGARSRLFIHENVRDVLEEDTGTDSVEAIMVDFPEGDNIIHLSPKAFKNMKRLRLFKCRNAHIAGESLNYLPNGIRVIDWPKCPLKSLPRKFYGNKLIVLQMPGSLIQQICMEFKNLTVMNFSDCEFLTKISDISSCLNLKEIDVTNSRNLVEIHDSVGSLDKLVTLSLGGCHKLKILPRRLQLRSLLCLDLYGCSSLQNFPEIEGKMENLAFVNLDGTAIEELPSSIGYLTGLLNLMLSGCLNLKRLPRSIHQLRSLDWLRLDYCPNIESFGIEEELSTMENEASSSAEVFPSMPPPTNSAISLFHDSSSLDFLSSLHLDLTKSSISKSNFFGSFSCFPNLGQLNLSGSDIVSIPASIKAFVRLWSLKLNDCKLIQEIIELPPNLTLLRARGCISLESLPDISKIFRFSQQRRSIDLSSCYKVNMGNRMPNPAWIYVPNRVRIIYPGNKIPDWFSHCKETSNNHWCELHIKGSHPYLEDIIGIAFCAVIEPTAGLSCKRKIYVKKPGEDRGREEIVLDQMDSDHVWLGYLPTKYITRRSVSVDADNLRIIFESSPNSVIFKHCGVHILYKHREQNVKDHVGVPHHADVHLGATIKDIGRLANPMDGIQLSQRRLVDYDGDNDYRNVESNLYPQRQRHSSSTLQIKFFRIV